VLERLVVATLLGGMVGLERSVAGKHAGMRTYALVTLGSCLFTLVGVLASLQFSGFTGVNPLHLAGFVVVGIGFIGAGLTQLRAGDHIELTTTSGIWVAAGIGIACGFGMYSVAVGATVLAILVLSLLLRLENAFRKRFGTNSE